MLDLSVGKRRISRSKKSNFYDNDDTKIIDLLEMKKLFYLLLIVQSIMRIVG